MNTLLSQLGPTFMDLLPDALHDLLVAQGTRVRYRGDQLIHSRGDDSQIVSIILSGGARAGTFGHDGSYTMTSILGPGQTFGEFTVIVGLPRSLDMVALGETEILELPGPKFTRLCDEQPELSKALLSSSLIRTYMLLEIMDAMRRLPLLERTAKLLLILAEAPMQTDHLNYTQADLAFTLGISRVSVSKAVGRLAELGLITLGYRNILVKDPAKLQNWLDRRQHLAV
ncbi:MAG: Crp/Fnr family transcriptional regulator [Pseudomonadota bacterium]